MRRNWGLWGSRAPRQARAKPPAPQARGRRMLWGATVVLALALWAILAVRPPTNTGLRVGYPSPVRLQAPRTISYVSKIRTEERRALAESAADTVVYQRDTTIPIEQRAQLTDLLQTIAQIRDDPSLTPQEREAKLTDLPNSTVVISPELAVRIARLPDQEWSQVRQQSVDLYDRALRERNFALTSDDVDTLRERWMPYWSSQSEGQGQDLSLLFASAFLRPNQIVDEEATARAKQEAREAVEPVFVQILEGESIVREGDRITPEVQEKLEALDLLQTEMDWFDIGGRGILAALVATMLGIYLGLARPQIWSSKRSLTVVYTLVTLAVLAARLVIVAPLGPSWPYAFPLAAVVLLLSALFDSALALVAATLLSLPVAFIGDSQFGLGAALLLSCVAGVFALRDADRSLKFLLAGIAVGLVVALTQFALWLMAGVGEPATSQLLPILSLSAMNGALSAIIALGLYNLVGQLAGIVTPFQLMELAHPAQPLLRKLIRDAPGTYYHSVAVGNLAESAAEAIGADALLLRVAAYYHDIGKAARPYFFTDNQSDRENVHNDLDPRTSAEIIAGHVREGVNMARAAGLPRQIVDFIPAHHGTSVIKHFYQIALQQEDTVDVADYSYPGPKPQTREQAILMLADSVEATVRSKAQNGKLISAKQAKANGTNGAQTLDDLVNSIIDERIRSGQLDESALTLQDIARIRQAFIATLQGIYHPRTDYAPQIVKTS